VLAPTTDLAFSEIPEEPLTEDEIHEALGHMVATARLTYENEYRPALAFATAERNPDWSRVHERINVLLDQLHPELGLQTA
jgi:hypothetical protein